MPIVCYEINSVKKYFLVPIIIVIPVVMISIHFSVHLFIHLFSSHKVPTNMFQNII